MGKESPGPRFRDRILPNLVMCRLISLCSKNLEFDWFNTVLKLPLTELFEQNLCAFGGAI